MSYFSRSHVIYFQQTATIRGFIWHDVCWWSDPGVPWWRSRPRQSHVYGSGLGGLLYSLCHYVWVSWFVGGGIWQFVLIKIYSTSFWCTLVWPLDTHRSMFGNHVIMFFNPKVELFTERLRETETKTSKDPIFTSFLSCFPESCGYICLCWWLCCCELLGSRVYNGSHFLGLTLDVCAVAGKELGDVVG